MSEVQNRLKEKIQEAATIRNIRNHTAQLRSRLVIEERDLAIMEKTLAKEQRDVELLEKEGLTTMFHKFLGDREDRLQKERQDYLTASLRYNELFKSVELIRYELNLLSKKESNLNLVEKEINSLIRDREKELLQFEPAIAAGLRDIIDQLDKLHHYEVDVNEACTAGRQALELISRTEYFLHEAQQPERYGRRGMGYHSNIVDHDAVNKAHDLSFQSKQALIKFSNEWKDVYGIPPIPMSMDLEDFGRFTDIFFNNLISDWILRQKVSKSLVGVVQTRQQVEAMVYQLDQEKNTVQTKLGELEKKRKEIILSN